MKGGIENDLFEDLLRDKKQIFKDKNVLRPAYAPNYLPHREKQINDIAQILVGALKGETLSNILIYGKTGTGKTVCVKYVGKMLEQIGESRGYRCSVAYLNCEMIDTQYRVLANLTRYFDANIPMTGWPIDQVYAEFKNAIDARDGTTIVILDELDKLVKKGDEILYTLSRINSELKNARLSMIGITNDLNIVESLDSRVRSSLGEEGIIFPPYDANQLRDILEQRAKVGFKEGVLDDGVIPLCAAIAAQEHGDARRALDLLRVSGEIAERFGLNKVEESHAREAQDKIELDRVTEVIKTLPTQSKLVLYASVLLDEMGSKYFSTGEVYNMYRRLCGNVGMSMLTQRRISDLISELDMLGIINAPVVSKGRYGRTKEISLNAPIETTKMTILEDQRLCSLSKIPPFVQKRL
jgi:cell division control protein 6